MYREHWSQRCPEATGNEIASLNEIEVFGCKVPDEKTEYDAFNETQYQHDRGCYN